jgi:adenylate cyclase
MQDLNRLRRAGEDAVRILVDLLPTEWDPRSGQEYTTIVFADVAGYSTHVAAGGDDAAVIVLRGLDDAVDDALAGRRIRVVKRLGDGLMLAARRPDEALGAMVEMVSSFDEAMDAQSVGLRLRAGAHQGTMRRQGSDYIGYHVNVAARVAERAAGGQVLTTANVLAGLDLEALGLHATPADALRDKGVNGAVELFEVSDRPFEDEGGILPFLRRALGA